VNARGLACLVLLSLVASCVGAQPSPHVSPRNATATLGMPQDNFDIGGYSLWMHCEGVGSPTVVLEAGLGSGSMAWRDIAPALETETRVCAYDRAGLGQSDRRSASPPTSAGDMADELARLLDAAGERGPYLLVGHSYGGMIVRLFAARHREVAEGIVFVDAASEHQFSTGWDPNSVEWRDGSRTVDRDRSAAELAAVDTLGAIPIIVLTEGQRVGFYESLWAEYQDELASLSTDALHMVARDAGHVIQDDAPALVIEAVRAVLESVRSSSPLGGCDARFEMVGA
jgi:pimeloyl-ACP methyl ester carboxylesterase